MTLTSFFNGLATNLIAGGVGAVLVLGAMFWSANKTAATHSKAKMTTWSMAPAIMVIAAIMTHGIAAAIAIPKLQAMFQSAPMQNTASMGSAIAQTLDGWLFSAGGEGGQLAGAAAFMAPNSGEGSAQSAPANYVNGGATASFASQPAPVQANSELQIVTNEQAVAAINAFDATPTPSAAEVIANVIKASNELPGTYTVKGGDSLAKIAQQIYGDAKLARFLCHANGLADCNSIRVGMVLAVPPANSIAPANNGGTTYMVSTQSAQPAQHQAASVQPVQRNLANGQVIITSNADAVNAINALAQPTAAPQPQPTARPAYVLDELLKKPANNGGGQAYIDQFLADQNNPQVASTGN